MTRVIPAHRSYPGRVPWSLTLALAILFAGGVAACGGSEATAAGTATGAATLTPATTASPSAASGTAPADLPSGGVEPTVVPGGVTISPGPPATRIPTTQTDWGLILDALPEGFPIYPGVSVAEPPAEPVSAAFDSDATVDRIAAWYQGTLAEAGYSLLDLSDALEDGSRVLDAQTDLPECRIQLTFRPQGGSTIIIVLYGAGCAGIGP
jgi:hypothetical protein